MGTGRQCRRKRKQFNELLSCLTVAAGCLPQRTEVSRVSAYVSHSSRCHDRTPGKCSLRDRLISATVKGHCSPWQGSHGSRWTRGSHRESLAPMLSCFLLCLVYHVEWVVPPQLTEPGASLTNIPRSLPSS